MAPAPLWTHYNPAQVFSLDRRAGPLCLCQPAPDRAVEPDAAGRMPAAAVRPTIGKGDRRGAGSPGRLRRKSSRRRYQAGLRRQDRPVHRARRRRGAGAGPARRDGARQGRLHPHLPPPRRRGARCRRRRQGRGTVYGTRGLRRMGCALAPANWPRSRRRRPNGSAAMHAINPAFIPRNHRIEAVIAAAVDDDDYAPVRGAC